MRVRTQLILAFLALAILPLAGITLYSYATSLAAFRTAVEADSRRLGEEMRQRLRDVRRDLARRIEEIGELEPAADDDDFTALYADLAVRMAGVADTVESFQLLPAGPSGPDFEPLVIVPSRPLAGAIEKLRRKSEGLEDAELAAETLRATVRELIARPQSRPADLDALAARDEQTEKLLGSRFGAEVRRAGRIVGRLKALVPAPAILEQVLARTPRREGEIPFARDAGGALFVDRIEDRRRLAELGVVEGTPAGPPALGDEWTLVEIPHSETGLVFGVARPVAAPLRAMQATAARNFAGGLALALVALAGVVWLSNRMTRRLDRLTAGAERLAAGDLAARVAVESRDEFGRLAVTFNRMAEELAAQQTRLVEEERRRREQEIQARLLEAENRRKGRELEEARRLQLSLLPRQLPEHPEVEVAVSMRTATEVGGDYYDFFTGPDGRLTAVIGDAAGHGARAGTMVTVVKGLLTAGAAEADLPRLLAETTRALKRMDLGRMNMALALVRIGSGRVAISSAGMPPALVFRSESGGVEEVELRGTPLGSFADASYHLWESALEPGDTILLMSDGFPELLGRDEEPLGYGRAKSLFAASGGRPTPEMIARLTAAAEDWTGGGPPADDITFVALRQRREPAAAVRA